jgi:hypothetical protein
VLQVPSCSVSELGTRSRYCQEGVVYLLDGNRSRRRPSNATLRVATVRQRRSAVVRPRCLGRVGNVGRLRRTTMVVCSDQSVTDRSRDSTFTECKREEALWLSSWAWKTRNRCFPVMDFQSMSVPDPPVVANGVFAVSTGENPARVALAVEQRARAFTGRSSCIRCNDWQTAVSQRKHRR